ncbi:MAG: LysR family transcriptional regulator [Parvibaculaceae bacterium]
MTLEQLRIFLAVAEREHMTRAAEALNLTQSATSAAIAALEAKYGAALFERVGRGIRLTEPGRLFLHEARAVLERAAAAERVLGDVADLSRGSLRLAASQTLASYWLPDKIVQFRRAYPGIALTLAIMNSEQVIAELHEMQADLGFVEGREGGDGLVSTVVGEDELYLVVARGHPWSVSTPDEATLRAGPWVMREPGSGTRLETDLALAALGIATAATERLELPSNEAVRSAVAAGGGAALLSRLVVESSLAAGDLVRVPFPHPPRNFRMLRHPQRHETAATRAFAAMLAAAPSHSSSP